MAYNPINIENRKYLLTGAGSGIGRTTAILLSKLKARLVLLDINEKGLNETNKLLDNEAQTYVCNVCDFDAIEEIIKDSVQKSGKFDGFSHFAGIASIMPIKAVEKETAQKLLNINTLPVLQFAKLLSNKRYSNNGSSFVLISSVYANVGSSANVLYAMSKAGIQGITKSLAIELSAKKIRVNCIAPGFIKTPMGDGISHFFEEKHDEEVEKMHPLGYGESEDIANAVIFLFSDMSKWITGTIMNVDGGFCAK